MELYQRVNSVKTAQMLQFTTVTLVIICILPHFVTASHHVSLFVCLFVVALAFDHGEQPLEAVDPPLAVAALAVKVMHAMVAFLTQMLFSSPNVSTTMTMTMILC